MQSFSPIHLIIIIGIVMIGLGLIFEGVGVNGLSEVTQATSGQTYRAQPAQPLDSQEIGRRADDIPSSLTREGGELVEISLTTQEIVAEMMPGVTYKYWTYDGTVPGPFLRVKEDDTVRITLHHGAGAGMHGAMQVQGFPTLADAEAFIKGNVAHAQEPHMDDGHAHGTGGDMHDAEGHATHSVDLHAVTGPGGGAALTQVGHDGPKTFEFKATHPGIYVYHCASAHVPTHIANGMYGLILVEPEAGMRAVDKEFYVMQGDFYTKGKFGELGHQEFDLEKMLSESPSYFAFNGRVGSLSGNRAMRANVGDTVRMYVGVGSHISSNFHVIGEIFDRLYPDGAIMNEPLRHVQTTMVPAGGAVMVEFTVDIPGTYYLVDHSLTRAIDKGALAELIVSGPENPEEFRAVQ